MDPGKSRSALAQCVAYGHRRHDVGPQRTTAARRPERPLPTIESLSRKNCELFQNFGQSLINVAVGFCQRRQGLQPTNCPTVHGSRILGQMESLGLLWGVVAVVGHRGPVCHNRSYDGTAANVRSNVSITCKCSLARGLPSQGP